MATTEPALLKQSKTCLRMIFYVAVLCLTTPDATAGPMPPSVGGTSNSGNGTGTAQVIDGPDPGAFADAFAGFGEAQSYTANLVYYGRVDGPPGTLVPLEVKGKARYDISGLVTDEGPYNTFYLAIGAVLFNGASITGVFAEAGVAGPLSATTTYDALETVSSGALYSIGVSATAEVNNPLGHQGQESQVLVSADPVITFAPGFDSTGYSLEFSPGIGNSFPSASAVPEPSTPGSTHLIVLESL